MALFVATGGYVGRIPVAPGTFGSLAGLIICFFLSVTSLPTAVVVTIALILVAVWASEIAEGILGEKDPGPIVIDEVAGMAVTLVGISFSVTTAIMGFVLFRLLDILKPPPVRWFQDNLPGGWGVVMDDVAAGIIGNILLRCILMLTGV